MELKFRHLHADEVEIRAARCGDGWAQLLLYKDARVDMNILDETVGPMNWQRKHSRDNANCVVSIWDEDKKQWVEKEDVGTESNTEAEKGLASDSFKRSCTCWGIGRELYSAPNIMVNIHTEQKNGRWQIPAKTNIYVHDFLINEGKISKLVICENDGHIIFNWSDGRARLSSSVPPKKPVEVKPVIEQVKEEKPAEPAVEPVKEVEYEGVDKNTIGRIAKMEVGKTGKGMNYMRVVYTLKYAPGDVEQFQPIVNATGFGEAMKVVKATNLFTDEELNAVSMDNLEELKQAAMEISRHKEIEYSIIKSTNARGYATFEVKRLN